ncbi:MAG: hypothetical protein Tsb0021_17180 [Chlamydiales bacterium]
MKNFIFAILPLFAFFYSTSIESALRGHIAGTPIYLRLETELAGKKELKEDIFGGGIFMSLDPKDRCGLCIRPFLVGGISLEYTLTSYGCAIGYKIPLHQNISFTPICGLSQMNLDIGPLKLMALGIEYLIQSIEEDVISSFRKESNSKNELIIRDEYCLKNLNLHFGGELLCHLGDQLHLKGIYLYGYGIKNKHYEILVEKYNELLPKDHSKGFFCSIMADYYFKKSLGLSIGGSYFYAHFKHNDLNVKGLAVHCGLTYLF